MKKPTTAWAVFLNGNEVEGSRKSTKKASIIAATDDRGTWQDWKDKGYTVAKVQITKI